MMQSEMNEQTVDRQLVDAGIGKDAEEQAIRPMFFHLFCAIRYYRDMTYAEKNKAGFLYRTKFKNTYSLTGFFKERKRNRDKKNFPPHPSYKEESGVLGKDYKLHIQQGGDASLFEIRQKAFWDACLKFEPEYDRQLLLKFFCYWAEQVNGTELMLWETKKSWNMRLRLKAWSKKSYQLDDKAAALRLEHAKGKMTKQAANMTEQQAIAAKRADDNARLEQEIRERKQGAVSYEEYLKMKHES
jgi:hypothetical protein